MGTRLPITNLSAHAAYSATAHTHTPWATNSNQQSSHNHSSQHHSQMKNGQTANRTVKRSAALRSARGRAGLSLSVPYARTCFAKELPASVDCRSSCASSNSICAGGTRVGELRLGIIAGLSSELSLARLGSRHARTVEKPLQLPVSPPLPARVSQCSRAPATASENERRERVSSC
jgi:hypothetical protein